VIRDQHGDASLPHPPSPIDVESTPSRSTE
jgi:hypothetical protein